MAGDFQLLVVLVLVVVVCMIIWSKNNKSIDGVQLKTRDTCKYVVRNEYDKCNGKCLGSNDPHCTEKCSKMMFGYDICDYAFPY